MCIVFPGSDASADPLDDGVENNGDNTNATVTGTSGSGDTAEAGAGGGGGSEAQQQGDGESAEASKQRREQKDETDVDKVTGLTGYQIVILAGMLALVVIVIVVVIGCTIKKKQLAANRRNNRIVPDDDADVNDRYERRDEFPPDGFSHDPCFAPPSYDDTVSPRGIDSMFQQDIFTTPSSGGPGPSTATTTAALARSPVDMSRYNSAYARAYDTVAPQVSNTNNDLPKKS